MESILQFFKGLFSVSEWPARWHCGTWSDFHGWLYIISDLSIWAAYFMIPVIILNYLFKKKTAIRFHEAYLYFALFILLCGITHFLDALMFWLPMYRLNALVRFFTAVVSLLTVYYLIKMLPRLSELKTNVELEREIDLRVRVEHKLEQANQSLQTFAAVASHDLKEPLRKISVFTSLLREQNENEFDKTSLGYADKILSSSSRMQLLIDDILMLSSLTGEVEFEEMTLNSIVQDAIEHLELNIQEKKVEISTEDLPVVYGNAAYLSQLFFNLISNAIKFCVSDPSIKLTSTIKDNLAVIHVADNGIGIKEEDRQRIFEAFHRLHAKSEFEGTGLGLAICKKIVDIHHGKIWVENNAAGGATFSVELPLSPGLQTRKTSENES